MGFFSGKKGMRRAVGLLLYLAAAGGFLAWNGMRTITIGRMVLPKAQALATAAALVLAATLASAWALLLARMMFKRILPLSKESLLDIPAVRVTLVVLLAGSLALYFYGRFVETRWTALKTVALGQGRNPVRLAVISDLHVEAEREPWTGLAGKVNSTDPDIIVFLGDSVNRPSALKAFRKCLKAMKARRAKVAVRGNWDDWYWRDLPLLDGTGFQWLDGETRTLAVRGQTLHLTGLPYHDDEDGAGGQKMLARLPDEDWRIFLYHTPDLFFSVTSSDLYLAGHTHGGQISIPFFGALVTLSAYGKTFERGLRHMEGRFIYVNPGIGVEPSVPLRLGVRPEVTLVLLGKKER
jgi:predicted MPP superfamily phosphohydrolase